MADGDDVPSRPVTSPSLPDVVRARVVVRHDGSMMVDVATEMKAGTLGGREAVKIQIQIRGSFSVLAKQGRVSRARSGDGFC